MQVKNTRATFECKKELIGLTISGKSSRFLSLPLPNEITEFRLVTRASFFSAGLCKSNLLVSAPFVVQVDRLANKAVLMCDRLPDHEK